MKLIAVLCLVVTVAIISSNATEICGYGSKSKENSGSKGHSGSGSKEKCHSGSNESKESCEKPVFLKIMDVNRGVAHCGPENILNTCACEPNEVYWIPCMIEFLGVEGQPEPYHCLPLDQLDCFLSQFPVQCMPHCPNGYGCNETCVMP